MNKIILSFVLLCAAWLVGLAMFIASLPQPSSAAPDRHDAIVVYTGGGGARISAGMALLSDDAAPRMLISGVHPDTTREAVANLWSGDPALFECCVELGWKAQTTIGNADEAAGWASAQDAQRILLVTSDFHMPRALAETRRAMPDAEITPHVVASSLLNDKGRPQSRKAWKKITGEYMKFLLARVKALGGALGL